MRLLVATLARMVSFCWSPRNRTGLNMCILIKLTDSHGLSKDRQLREHAVMQMSLRNGSKTQPSLPVLRKELHRRVIRGLVVGHAEMQEETEL